MKETVFMCYCEQWWCGSNIFTVCWLAGINLIIIIYIVIISGYHSTVSIFLFSLSPESSSIHLMPTLEEKPMLTPPPSPPPTPPQSSHAHLSKVGNLPRKATTLPARVDPSEVFTLSSEGEGERPLSNGSIGHIHTSSVSSLDRNSTHHRPNSSHGKDPENLDCINELIEEGLDNDRQPHANHYHSKQQNYYQRRHHSASQPHYVNVTVETQPEVKDLGNHYHHQGSSGVRRHRHSTGSQSMLVHQPLSSSSHNGNDELWRQSKMGKKRSSADQWWLRYENGYKTGDSSSVYPYRSMTMQQ